jgi:hypothetical protein
MQDQHSPADRDRLLQDPALAGAFASPQRPRLGLSFYPAGLPLGSLMHISGAARDEALPSLLREHPGLRAAWVEARPQPYPAAFLRRMERAVCLLLDGEPGLFPRAVAELVRWGGFRAVAVATPLPDALSLRRLQLAAEHAACVVLLLGKLPEEAWPVRSRLEWRWEGAELRVRGTETELKSLSPYPSGS